MHKYLLILSILIIGCSSSQNENPLNSGESSEFQSSITQSSSEGSSSLDLRSSSSISSSAIEISSSSETTPTCISDSIDSGYLYSEFFNSDSLTITGQFSRIQDQCNGSVLLAKGDSINLNFQLNDTIANGMLSYNFKPSAKWHPDSSYALVGTNEGRLLITYSNKQIHFFKNTESVFRKVVLSKAIYPTDSTIHIVAQWGKNGMHLVANNDTVSKPDFTSYIPSPRYINGNDLLIGYKNSCCMDNLSKVLYTEAQFDALILDTNHLPITREFPPTIYLDFESNGLVDGYRGKAISALTNYNFGPFIPNGAQSGTVTFWYKPDSAYIGITTIIGDEGSRFHLVVYNDSLYFQKNNEGVFHHVKNIAPPIGIWTEITASWGPKGLTLGVGDTFTSNIFDTSIYASSQLSNNIQIARRTTDHMSAIGVLNPNQMTQIQGNYDEFYYYSYQR